MISGDEPSLEESELPFEGVPPLKVHRLIVEGFELSNAVERAQWNCDPAMLQACELCGQPWCSGRGAARFRRLGEQLVWLRTRAEDFRRDDEPPRSIEEQGAIGRAAWDRILGMGYGLPEFDSFPPLLRADLGRLWLEDMPEGARVDTFTSLDVLLHGELAACGPLEGEAARRRVRELVAWFEAAPGEPVAGRIARVDPPEGLQVFIFERAGYPDWPAFAASDRPTLAFGGGFLHEFPPPGLGRPSGERR